MPAAPSGPLIEAGAGPLGYLEILQGSGAIGASLEDYFAFCLACHHATVGTFVPTDVDSKIRGLLWRHVRSPETARRMFDFTVRSLGWSVEGISRKAIDGVSGHNGEQLSVLAGALGTFLRLHDEEYTGHAAQAIAAELDREAAAFRAAQARKNGELDVLRLSAALTHNVGDLDQGISFWPSSAAYREHRDRFGRLAHENSAPSGGAFHDAARVYRQSVSAEGHRNYPLRAVKALRQSPDLLLPFGPFLDEWGALVARHPSLTPADRAETLAALLHGCRTIPGQRGYYRAIAGINEALGAGIEAILRLLPNRARSAWKEADLRRHIAVPRPSFESMMRKLARI